VVGLRPRKHILISDTRRVGPDPEYVVPCGTKRSDRIARKVFIRKESHRQAIAAGYTFSDCNISLAYCRRAAMSSCVIPGVVPQNVGFGPALTQ